MVDFLIWRSGHNQAMHLYLCRGDAEMAEQLPELLTFRAGDRIAVAPAPLQLGQPLVIFVVHQSDKALRQGYLFHMTSKTKALLTVLTIRRLRWQTPSRCSTVRRAYSSSLPSEPADYSKQLIAVNRRGPEGPPELLFDYGDYHQHRNPDAPPESQKRQQAQQELHSCVTVTVSEAGTSTETGGVTSAPVLNGWLIAVPMTAPLTSRRDTSAV